MSAGQRFTNDPRLALAYYYCCGVDPKSFGCGDEQLDANGGDGEKSRGRLEKILSEYPKPSDTATCQKMVYASESESTDIWACASCGRVLLETDNRRKIVVRSLRDLRALFVLDDLERKKLFGSCSEDVVKKYRQVYIDGEDVYYLIPELVSDQEAIPLCEKCAADPRKSPFSVASGHDYGRVSDLPELSSVALGCIAPVRCFGTEISLSGKHSSGHIICFPSDGPDEVAKVLPHVHPECMPRVTFIGPEEEWRVQRKKFRGLYALPVDAVYEWLGVLGAVNNIFRDEQIWVDGSEGRRRQLNDLVAAIENSVDIANCVDVGAVQDLATSERYGNDISEGVERSAESRAERPVVTQQSAILPDTRAGGDSLVPGMIDALLGALSQPESAGNGPMPLANANGSRENEPVIAIKRGSTPMIEWHENAKMLAGAFPELFLTGSGPLPSGPLTQACIYHFMH
ncbi:hypothetical protein PF011_g20367 [Phytophthora fragariae]|uniref:DUF6570 domain-containing protein n=1 Tax=Phytophthora fragariae TaxID=53985 RepID=A0A6A3IRC5_9STRA|nr:hypothetical protein PF011_g20367 [Phytophthora fragariae]